VRDKSLRQLILLVASAGIVLLTPLPLPASDLVHLTGVVCSHEAHRPLANVYIKLSNGKVLAVTDESGEYAFDLSDRRPITVFFSLIGYRTESRSLVFKSSTMEHQTDTVFLKIRPEIAEGITVLGDIDSQRDLATPNWQTFDSKQLRTASGSLGDPMRYLQQLPSVTVSSDYRNDLIVRGGNPAEMAILVDGFETTNVNHFGTQGSTGGLFGILSSDNVSEVNFSAGGFSVKYPNRLSGLTEIKIAGKEEMKSGAKVSLDLSGLSGSVGMASPTSSSYLQAHGRQSYLDLLKGQLNLPAAPMYRDMVVKSGFKLGQKQLFSIFGLASSDRFSLPPGVLGFDDGSLEYSQTQSFTGLKWIALLSPESVLETKYGLSYSQCHIKGYFSSGFTSYDNLSVERSHKLSCDFSSRQAEHLELNLGASYKYSNADYQVGMSSHYDDFGRIWPTSTIKEKLGSGELGEYLEIASTHLHKLRLTLGIRYDYQVMLDAGLVSPRVSASYALSEAVHVFATLGRFGQAPPLFWLAADKGNRTLDYIRATHRTAGVRYDPNPNLQLLAEIYHKCYLNYPVNRYESVRTMVDFGTDYRFYETQFVSEEGKGFARGAELSLKKRFGSRVNSVLGLSLHTSRFTGISQKEIEGDFNTAFIINISADYQFTDFLQIAAHFAGAGGRPYTPISPRLSYLHNYTVLEHSQINAKHYPPYHRLDIKVTFNQRIRNGQLSAYIDVMNVYNRKNVYMYYWDSNDGEIEALYQWQLLPLLGITYQF
jgi:hypothetical protein